MKAVEAAIVKTFLAFYTPFAGVLAAIAASLGGRAGYRKMILAIEADIARHKFRSFGGAGYRIVGGV